MGFIFRSGDSRRAKQFTVFLLAIICIGIWAGLNRRNFLPSDSTHQAAVIAGIFVSFVSAYALFRDANPDAPFNRFGPTRRAFFVLLCAMVTFIAGWMATFGIAAAILQFVVASHETQTTVQFVYPPHEGKGCRYRLKLIASTPQVEISPCVSEKIWRIAKQGEIATAVVASNPLGFQFIDLRPAN